MPLPIWHGPKHPMGWYWTDSSLQPRSPVRSSLTCQWELSPPSLILYSPCNKQLFILIAWFILHIHKPVAKATVRNVWHYWWVGMWYDLTEIEEKETRKWESKGANGLKTLLLGETVAKKKKKSSKKQMTTSQSTDEEEFMATMNALGQGLVLLSSNK